MKHPLLITLLFCSISALGQQNQHVVQRGENLERIARKYGVTTEAIKKANPDLNNLMYVGMTIMIPSQTQANNSSPVVDDDWDVPAVPKVPVKPKDPVKPIVSVEPIAPIAPSNNTGSNDWDDDWDDADTSPTRTDISGDGFEMSNREIVEFEVISENNDFIKDWVAPSVPSFFKIDIMGMMVTETSGKHITKYLILPNDHLQQQDTQEQYLLMFQALLYSINDDGKGEKKVDVSQHPKKYNFVVRINKVTKEADIAYKDLGCNIGFYFKLKRKN